ncbi:MAG: hypothetical protein NZM35_10470 [Chitinophagales bacterium]|nr:hypothetical protein [Chitinophagales bacterium]MDW8419754.1 hypothetical protein [Chitinophagales bacterium]
MMKYFLPVLLLLGILHGFPQVGINILIPDSSAVLQLESDKKGLGLPRLTKQQRDAIANPLKGLTIYNTTDSVIEYWNAECWLKVYQKKCYDCDFVMTIDDPADTLDRLVADSVFSTITVNQTNGNQPINLIFLSSLPQGVSVQFNGNPTINQSGSVQIVVKADLCTPVGGNYPIIIQAYCGDAIKFQVYNVYIRPPVQINIPVDQINYDLQAINNLPSSPAQYIYCNIGNSVEIKSNSNNLPAFTTGNLDPNSLICLQNYGAILGRGGDGGSVTFSGNLFVVGGEGGQKGGDALNLTARTVLLNNGAIYGGGSGGGSVGVAIGTPSIPIIGSIVIGFVYCGGGGSESGKGGTVNPGGINIGLFANGNDATCCINSVPGAGPVGNFPISIPISVASINITPNAYGGNGGPFGQQGTQGYLDVQLEVCVNIPLIGNICIPIPIPGNLLPYYGPQSDLPGYAIRRNNNTLIGLNDGTYNTAQVKGKVGN